ncbi:MAG: hypothetical protein HN382_04605 [Gammaproteobacteria bacterium]|nr:hypothetical protein [Gammaproteobacteria bacterium]MBT4608136.1 hypothetical protein [Thiotrichales bacterium]MBT7830314.1 hypothetical protein [Candidatus Neomarinimicrobiota bacterium]MBT3471916.1 hypothetical protein [Gammaproteobacteria bacterium]MBT3966662.1 hypothetical protein [Gammaproteobacteria bacterium]
MIKKLSMIALLAPIATYAWGEEHWCNSSDIYDGKCTTNDIFISSAPVDVRKFCDFERPVTTQASGDASDISGIVYCYYRGSERKHVGR